MAQQDNSKHLLKEDRWWLGGCVLFHLWRTQVKKAEGFWEQAKCDLPDVVLIGTLTGLYYWLHRLGLVGVVGKQCP